MSVNRLFVPLLCAALCLPSFAQGETFENEEAWGDAVVGEVIPTDFGSLIGREAGLANRWIEIDGVGQAVFEWSSDILGRFDELELIDPIPRNPGLTMFTQAGFVLPQTLPWGELSTQSNTLAGVKEPRILDAYDFRADYAIVGRDIELSLDPELGQLSGVSFRINPAAIATISLQTQVRFFEGDVIVAAFDYEPTLFGSPDLATSYLGWTNSDDLNVTRIVISFVKEDFTEIPDPFEDGEDVLIIPYLAGWMAEGELAFTQVTTDPSSQELLDEILVNVGSIPATGNPLDNRRITRAIDRLNDATNPDFWEDEDTLSDRGREFFRLVNGAVRDLLRIRQPSAEVEQAIEDLNSLLEGIVETEIAEATAAGGRQNFLNAAEFYQELGGFYASAEIYQFAGSLRAWAWYLARVS
jgi:hypothetical protein